MKKKGILILLTLSLLFLFTLKYNGKIKGFFFDFISPIKNVYRNFTDMGDSYFNQHKELLALKQENAKLKKLLIEQSHYIDQLSKIYHILPSLEKKPYKSIYLVNTISYVKLNRLDEVLLTTPNKLKNSKKELFGLIQNDFASGLVQNIDGKLYAYLLSHPKCTFGVSIGTENVHGIAQGDGKKGMIIKFIPRWSKINIGDKVKTSGLDDIFFPNIPVGVVSDVETLDQYKEAKIKIYANISKPDTFFLISDPSPYLTSTYEPKDSFPGTPYPYVSTNSDSNSSDANSTNVGTAQTKENIVNPTAVKENEYKEVLDFGSILKSPIKIEKK